MEKLKKIPRHVLVFCTALVFVAVAQGFSDSIYANYFKEAYHITAVQRGAMETPRELPGLLCVAIITALSFLGDIRIAIVAQLFGAVGIACLSVGRPPYAATMLFLFTFSMGIHLFMPLQDSIGMSIVERESEIPQRVGQYKSVNMASSMLAALAVFLFFRTGVFSFTTNVRGVFVLSALCYLAAAFLLLRLYRLTGLKTTTNVRHKTKLRREYIPYYILSALNGIQKLIRTVYGPWLLIEVLKKGADTVSMLLIFSSLIGIFFSARFGRWVGKRGVRWGLFFNAFAFILTFSCYGIICTGFYTGVLATEGWPVLLVYGMYIMDRISNQTGMIRSLFLRSIAVDTADVTGNLSLGVTIDHAVCIVAAYLGGLIWSAFGPQWIFFIAAGVTVVTLVIAAGVKRPQKAA